MKPIYKILLTLEIISIFTYPAYNLLVGIALNPFAIYFNGGMDIRFIPLMYSLVAGIFGIAGIISLLLKIITSHSKFFSPILVLLFLTMGISSIFVFSYSFKIPASLGLFLFAVLPILGTLHLTYLGRRYLFAKIS